MKQFTYKAENIFYIFGLNKFLTSLAGTDLVHGSSANYLVKLVLTSFFFNIYPNDVYI